MDIGQTGPGINWFKNTSGYLLDQLANHGGTSGTEDGRKLSFRHQVLTDNGYHLQGFPALFREWDPLTIIDTH